MKCRSTTDFHITSNEALDRKKSGVFYSLIRGHVDCLQFTALVLPDEELSELVRRYKTLLEDFPDIPEERRIIYSKKEEENYSDVHDRKSGFYTYSRRPGLQILSN